MGRRALNPTKVADLLDTAIMLSSEVITQLQESSGMSRKAASRAVEREVVSGRVYSSKPASLGEGRDFLLWLPRNFGALYFSEIREKLTKRPSFECAVEALVHNGGTLPASYLRRCIPSPTRFRRGTPSVEQVVEDLQRLNLISISPGNGGEISIDRRFAEYVDIEAPPFPFNVKLRAEGLILKEVARWLQATMFVAWNSVKVRNSASGCPVDFNDVAFDLVAPTYLQPVVRMSEKKKPGFVLSDLSIGEFSRTEAISFVRKIAFVRNRMNAPIILPICFADSFEPEAFNILRRNGISAMQLSRIGSKSLPEICQSIAQIFQKIESEGGIANIGAVISSLGKLVGERETNMAGSLFVIMLTLWFNHSGYRIVAAEQRIQGEVQGLGVLNREIDLAATRGDELVLCEAKGYHQFQPVKLHEVRRFFEEVAPLGRQLLARPTVDSVVTYSFFTTSYFDKDALVYLQQRQAAHRTSRRLRIEFHTGEDLKELAVDEGLPLLKTLVNRYFGTHRKMVYDPKVDEMVETPDSHYEYATESIPDPEEILDAQTVGAV